LSQKLPLKEPTPPDSTLVVTGDLHPSRTSARRQHIVWYLNDKLPEGRVKIGGEL